jgi:plastocyanin
MAPRARSVAIAAACWLLLLAGAARAVDDHPVSIKFTSYTDGASGTPMTVVAENDTVTWHWDGSGSDLNHSVTSDDGTSFNSETDPGGKPHGSHVNGDTFTVVFPTSGCFQYHCVVHGSMHGQVQVGTGVCPPLPPPGGGGGGGGGGGNGPPPPPPPASPPPDTTPPAFSAVREKSKRLVFNLSEPAKVTVKIRKGHKLVKTFHISGKPGVNSFRLTHRGLKKGVKYSAVVSAVDSAGNKSLVKRLTLKL